MHSDSSVYSKRVAAASLLFLLTASLAGSESAAARRQSAVSPTAAADAAHAEVLAELQQYYADLSARDWDAFASHFWPGATITTVWQPPGENQPRVVVTSIPDFVAQAPQGAGSKPIFEEKMTSAEVRLHRNLSQVWARYQARFGDPGQVREWSGIDAFTLMKHDGRWRIVSLVFAGDD